MGINSPIIITSYSKASSSYIDIPVVILHTVRYGHYAMFIRPQRHFAICVLCLAIHNTRNIWDASRHALPGEITHVRCIAYSMQCAYVYMHRKDQNFLKGGKLLFLITNVRSWPWYYTVNFDSSGSTSRSRRSIHHSLDMCTESTTS